MNYPDLLNEDDRRSFGVDIGVWIAEGRLDLLEEVADFVYDNMHADLFNTLDAAIRQLQQREDVDGAVDVLNSFSTLHRVIFGAVAVNGVTTSVQISTLMGYSLDKVLAVGKELVAAGFIEAESVPGNVTHYGMSLLGRKVAAAIDERNKAQKPGL